MFAYLNLIQSAHKRFLGLSWLAYDIDFRRRAAQASLAVGLTTCLIPALYLPIGITQAQSVTPAGTSTKELPASGHLTPTPTVAQYHTQKTPLPASMLISPLRTTPYSMLLLIMPSISSSPLGRVPLCPRQTFSLPFA